ncbi:MBL fold metallo-hydrolase [Paenibacillus senegalimassiliensis]|uniref:MBL fold metallo-hydrolase n=1 Tax=Paenibacillus senegalimassiliensis TaxID=1737426 RepID=UPI00073F6BBF|nr:MBL fold metallo-hydrolase [Paenibacillus senegalimassiliensis]
MRFIRHQHLVQLTHLPYVFPVNCYLVEEQDSLTLVDAGWPINAKDIVKAARRIGKPITRILLTHTHVDHVGAVDHLKWLLPEVQLYLSEREAKLLAGDKSLVEGEANVPIRGGLAKPGPMKAKPDILLKEGDIIGSLVSIAAPGHTPGQMAFMDTRNRSLIVGDAFQTRGGLAIAGQMRLLFPFPALSTWDKRTSIETARKLLELKPSLIAPGHGNLALEPQHLMEAAIKRADKELSPFNGQS